MTLDRKVLLLASAAFAVTLAATPCIAAGQATSLYSFAGATGDAAAAFGAPVSDGGALLLGTSYEGGTGPCTGFLAGCGTIYSLALHSRNGTWTATESVVLNFQGGNDGSGPKGTLVAGPGGVFYGTTSQGGTNSNGTIFSLTKQHGKWIKSILHNFTGADGGSPSGTMLLGSDGALYGTADGGQYGQGVVFQLKPPVAPGTPWIETPIFSFPATYPNAPATPTALIGDPSTGFYGTTEYGGSGPCTIYNGGNPPIPSGCGTVYTLQQASPGIWTQAVIYNFQGGRSDGKNAGALIMGGDGKLYGTTYDGGRGPTKYCPFGCGIVYSLAAGSTPGSWTETVLTAFFEPSEGYANPTGLFYISSSELMITTVPRDGDAFSTVLDLKPDTARGTWSPRWSIGDALGQGETNPFLTPYHNTFLGVAAYGGAHSDGSVFLLTHGQRF
jgi:uncharacterized repeat protein (TIGR03803 family)